MGYFSMCAPEECGISSQSILDFIESLNESPDTNEVHSFMLVRHGKLVCKAFYAPFEEKMEHTVFSVSKAVVSMAVGIAFDEGLLDVDDYIADYFPERMKSDVSSDIRKIKIRHLLSMTTGQEGGAVHATKSENNSEITMLDAFFYRPVTAEPGKCFRYDSYSTYMLSALITKLTKKNVIDYLMPRLFRPLKIPKPFYIKDENNVFIGYSSLRFKIEDLSKLGQLYLNKGVWDGKRIISEEWIDFSVKKHADTSQCPPGPDWQEGYAASFWLGRYNTFRFCGALGQMCVVMPELDAVFCVNSGYNHKDIPFILDKFYEHIMLNMNPSPLEIDKDASSRLSYTLKHLELIDVYSNRSPIEQFIDGVSFDIETPCGFDRMSLEFSGDYCRVNLSGKKVLPLSFKAGFKKPLATYLKSTNFAPLSKTDELDLYAAAHWEDKGHLIIKGRLVPSPTMLFMDIVFKDYAAAVNLYTVRGNFDKK